MKERFRYRKYIPGFLTLIGLLSACNQNDMSLPMVAPAAYPHSTIPTSTIVSEQSEFVQPLLEKTPESANHNKGGIEIHIPTLEDLRKLMTATVVAYQAEAYAAAVSTVDANQTPFPERFAEYPKNLVRSSAFLGVAAISPEGEVSLSSGSGTVIKILSVEDNSRHFLIGITAMHVVTDKNEIESLMVSMPQLNDENHINIISKSKVIIIPDKVKDIALFAFEITEDEKALLEERTFGENNMNFPDLIDGTRLYGIGPFRLDETYYELLPISGKWGNEFHNFTGTYYMGYKAPATFGNSGTLIADEEGNAVGILMGIDDELTKSYVQLIGREYTDLRGQLDNLIQAEVNGQ